jgi:hypothetical protein
VLSMIDDDVVFATATVDGVAGTVSWPMGIDLDPDVLHGGREVSGHAVASGSSGVPIAASWLTLSAVVRR